MEFKRVIGVFTEHYLAIPDYQRDYSWTNAETGALFDDIKDLVYSDSGEVHFLGAIVTTTFDRDSYTAACIKLTDYGIDSSDVRLVVDGQQRLTSLSLLMKAIADSVSRDVASEDDQKNLRGLLGVVTSCLQGTDLSDDASMPAPRLILNGDTGRRYMNYLGIAGSDIGSGAYAGARRLKKAYELFTKEIEILKNDWLNLGADRSVYSFYRLLLTVITKQLKLVVIECEDAMSAFQVFDSLNGKGLDLTAADRIKNIFLSWCRTGSDALNKWNSVSNEVGSDNLVQFYSCYLYYKNGSRVPKRKLPDVYKNLFHETAKSDFNFFYHQQKEAAEVFACLKNYKTGVGDLDKRLLPDLAAINQDQVYVPLFAALFEYRGKGFDRELVEFAEELTKLLVRMQVCEKSTNRLDTIFADCIKRIKEYESLKVVSDLVSQKTHEMADDTQFKAAFAELAPAKPRVAEYYLRMIENHLRERDGRRDVVQKDAGGLHRLTVEHIIPQDLDALQDWYGSSYDAIPEELLNQYNDVVIRSIGNLALLYDDDNSAAKNHTYAEKKHVYEHGSNNSEIGSPVKTFVMMDHLLGRYPNQFQHDQVKDRADVMATLAAEIW
ncbi:MAG: DUF262 domain-containing HNH endonuclease family protein [Atopobiaceae bacterium]|jgi:hypothetical protein|nr:DUF262 domain-containing HNH endonuclease family protein [Atopobiaceae bacterium]